MTMQLFSGFDPHGGSLYLPLDITLVIWMMVLMLPVMLQGNYVFFAHPLFRVSLSRTMRMIEELISQSELKKLGGSMPFFLGLMSYISTINLSGQAPYVFSTSSHLAFNLSMAFPIWLTMILLSFTYKLLPSLAHLLPNSSPWYLTTPLVLIETVSNLVRPLTLAVRLTANITTGHILMSLLSVSIMSTTTLWAMTLTMMVGIFYTSFELAIVMIQAYIFVLLPTLYGNEHAN